MFVITYVFTLHFHIHISFMQTNFSNWLLFKFAYFYQTGNDCIFWPSLELNLTWFFAHLSHIWTLKNCICIYLLISIVTVHFRSRTWNTLLSKKETLKTWNETIFCDKFSTAPCSVIRIVQFIVPFIIHRIEILLFNAIKKFWFENISSTTSFL